MVLSPRLCEIDYPMTSHDIDRLYAASIRRRPTLPAILPATAENIAAAKAFVMRKWTERAVELGRPVPSDLSNSCKFSSLFAQAIFGGRLEGHVDHQYVRLTDGSILDLNAEAADVKAMANPHRHDSRFWGNAEHADALRSCKPRVDRWIEEFLMITAYGPNWSAA
jgi:hypothetical protein